MNKISQREARRLRKQVREQSNRISDLEWDIRRWREYTSLPEGEEIYADAGASTKLQWIISTAQTLKHTVTVRFYGDKLVYKALPSPTITK